MASLEGAAGAPPEGEGAAAAEIAPLLADVEAPLPAMPRISIFSISRSHSRTRSPNKEGMSKAAMVDELVLSHIFSWSWEGSKFSGMVCMALASSIYWMMEFLASRFVVKPIPLFEIVLTRCTVVLILSFMWLRRTGQPILGLMNTRAVVISRALVGCLSLLCFIYSVQNLPLHYAIMANLASPVVASFAARLLLEEKLSLPDIGGLTCSYLGILFLYHPLFAVQGALMETGQAITSENDNVNHVGPLFVGILSSLAGGVSYCLVKSAAKATDQPVFTVFIFGAVACPLSAICGFLFEKLILPDLYSFIITVILGVLAFFAEVFLARGLQLEKTSKATNILYLKVLLTQISSMAFLKVSPSFCRLLGCVLLLTSICSTVYFGAPKEIS